jgi:hypothetical protein
VDVRDVARAARRFKIIIELKYVTLVVSDRRVIYDELRHVVRIRTKCVRVFQAVVNST